MPKRVKISGERGRWVAEAEGRWLPVVHTTWRRGMTGYFDPMSGAKVDGKRYAEFIDALRRETFVVVQRDKPGTFERGGYVGIFAFKDLVIGDDGSVSLTLVSRYADPAT
jgi:hypothetical protein